MCVKMTETTDNREQHHENIKLMPVFTHTLKELTNVYDA